MTTFVFPVVFLNAQKSGFYYQVMDFRRIFNLKEPIIPGLNIQQTHGSKTKYTYQITSNVCMF